MQFGLFYEWPNPTLRNWKTLFEEGLEQIRYSEELGFDYCLIAEHHFTNYGNSPAPLMQALYIAQHTERISIGTASVILPVWQPLRLAEEVATPLSTRKSAPIHGEDTERILVEELDYTWEEVETLHDEGVIL